MWFHELELILFKWINKSWSNSFFDIFMPLITHMADKKIVFIWLFSISVFIGFYYTGKIEKSICKKERFFKMFKIFIFFSLFTSVIYGINGGIIVAFKNIFLRLRPYVLNKVILRASSIEIAELSENHSFFSGHASNAFMVATMILLMFKPKVRNILFYSLAVLIALSRVYLGIHFLSDVIVGAIIGITSTFLLFKLYNKCLKKKILGKVAANAAE